MTQPSGVSRRSFLKSVALGASAVSVPAALTGCFGDDDDDRDLTVFVFGHGVASGDPLADAVIIWTRVTPDNSDGTEAEVAWVVARDEAMTDVVASGKEYTDAARDFTVKVDVTGLQPGTSYYYQFAGKDNAASPVGHTKTLPSGAVDRVTLAVCSCANYPAGFFNAYKAMADSDADVVVHLGDYIYEYGSNEYPSPDAQGRTPEPVNEILTLEQYRARYAQYRADVDLQAVHQHKPFICVWDDHELANDTYKDGAQNHNDGEGDFTARRDAAHQAYHEWLPIRTGADRGKIYRSFDFGNLLSLHMCDTRMLARDKPLAYGDFADAEGNIDIAGFSAALADSSRTLLGAEQQQQLVGDMIDSTATWQVLGQQVLMGRIMIPIELLSGLGEIQAMLEAGVDASAKQAEVAQLLGELATLKATDPSNARLTSVAPYTLDAWDGYFPAREEILRRAQLLDKNLVVLAGDTHNAWASELYVADDSGVVQRQQGAVGVEFATASVTSPGFETYVGFGDNAQLQAGFEGAVAALVDDLKFLNAKSRGFMRVQFTQQKASCDWVFVDTIASKEFVATTAKTLTTYPGKGQRRLS